MLLRTGYDMNRQLVKVEPEKRGALQEVASVYYAISFDASQASPPAEAEMTDEEFRVLATRSKSYDFWKTDLDDIYDLSDGTPL